MTPVRLSGSAPLTATTRGCLPATGRRAGTASGELLAAETPATSATADVAALSRRRNVEAQLAPGRQAASRWNILPEHDAVAAGGTRDRLDERRPLARRWLLHGWPPAQRPSSRVLDAEQRAAVRGERPEWQVASPTEGVSSARKPASCQVTGLVATSSPNASSTSVLQQARAVRQISSKNEGAVLRQEVGDPLHA